MKMLFNSNMEINENKIMFNSEIVRLHNEKKTPTEIYKIMNIPRTNVYNTIKKYIKRGTILKLPGTGRKESLRDEDVSIVLEQIENASFVSYKRI